MDRRDWLLSEDPAAMLQHLTHERNLDYGEFQPRARPLASDRQLRLWSKAAGCELCLDVTNDPDLFTAVARAEYIATASCDRHAEKAGLLREIIGDPWEPLTIREEVSSRWPGRVYVFQPTWLTPSVLSLARVAYDQQDWSALGPLSDALESEGCDCEPLLMHLRGKERCLADCTTPMPWKDGKRRIYDFAGPDSRWVICPDCNGTGWQPLRGSHVRGCWAIELLLGKS